MTDLDKERNWLSSEVKKYEDAKERLNTLLSDKYRNLSNTGAGPLLRFLLNRIEALEKEVSNLKQTP